MKSGFFTRSCYSVPHRRIGERRIMIAHLAITKSFDLIRSEVPSLREVNENEITTILENVLVNRVWNRGVVEGLDSMFFGKVCRTETVNFDGTKLSKRPDLRFDLMRENKIDCDRTQDALFAECKPVDKKHYLKSHYCGVGTNHTGIERFIIGDYAWAMEEALMIAYVRDDFSPLPDLENALQDVARHEKLGAPFNLREIPTETQNMGLYHSLHQRYFNWISNGKKATPVDVYHSWHCCE